MKTTITVKIITPRTPNFVTDTDGTTYQIGGLDDDSIRRLGEDMIASMLETAKRQRASKKQEGK